MVSAGSVLAWLCLSPECVLCNQRDVQLAIWKSLSLEVSTGDEGEEYGFDRGSRRSYELEVGDALGTLRSVFVQQVWCRSSLALGLIHAPSKALHILW